MIRACGVALTFAVAIGTAALAQQDRPGDQQETGTQQGSMQMQHETQSGGHQMQNMQMTGDADRDFVKMMRQHHQQGIEMAKTELKDGKDATAKGFARKIIQQQQKEIKQLDEWLSKHGDSK